MGKIKFTIVIMMWLVTLTAYAWINRYDVKSSKITIDNWTHTFVEAKYEMDSKYNVKKEVWESNLRFDSSEPDFYLGRYGYYYGK